MNEICVSNDIHKGDKPAILFQSMKWFLCIWLLFHFVMPSHAIAQSSPSKLLPELYVGSFGNEVLLSLTFEDEVEDNTELTLALEESSGVASNVKIVERKKLSSVSKRIFAVSFDIAVDVEELSEQGPKDLRICSSNVR